MSPFPFVCVTQANFEYPIVSENIDSAKEEDSDTLTFVMDFKPEKAGTYAICLDNRKSRFLQKIVQVRLMSSLWLISTLYALTLNSWMYACLQRIPP
jgi:hypothetical protein